MRTSDLLLGGHPRYITFLYYLSLLAESNRSFRQDYGEEEGYGDEVQHDEENKEEEVVP